MKAGRFVVFLAIVLTVMVLLLGWMRWQKNESLPAILPVPPAESSLAPLALMAPAIPEKGTSDILLRPVFWKVRGPYVPPPPRKGRPKAKPRPPQIGPDVFDQVKLLGTYRVNGKAKLIVQSSEGSKRVTEGEELDGWVFESMGKEGAIFSQDGEQRILVMKKPVPPTKEELEKQAAEIKARNEKRAAKAAAKLAIASGEAPAEEPQNGDLATKPNIAGGLMDPAVQAETPSEAEVELSDFEKSYRRFKERAQVPAKEAQNSN